MDGRVVHVDAARPNVYFPVLEGNGGYVEMPLRHTFIGWRLFWNERIET